jgi:hypothetical protein
VKDQNKMAGRRREKLRRGKGHKAEAIENLLKKGEVTVL